MRGARPRRPPPPPPLLPFPLLLPLPYRHRMPASGQGWAGRASRDGECDAQDGDGARLLGRRLRPRGGGRLRILLTCAHLARPRHETCPISTEGWTRRVQLVRRDGRDVSTLYRREGGGAAWRRRRGEASAGGAAVQGTRTSVPSTSASSAALPPTAQCGAFRASAASSSVSACRRPTCARQAREL